MTRVELDHEGAEFLLIGAAHDVIPDHHLWFIPDATLGIVAKHDTATETQSA